MVTLPFKLDPQLIDRLARYRREVVWVMAGISAVALLLALGLLISGAFAAALLAVLLSAVSAVAGGIAWRGLGLAEEVAENAARIEELRPRVDVLEATVELHSAQAGLSATLVDDLASIIHDRVPERRYPRLAFPGIRVADSDAGLSDPAPASKPQVAARVPTAAAVRVQASAAARMSTPPPTPPAEEYEDNEDDTDEISDPLLLREIFAACIRMGDFETALARGEEIVALAPHSRMAADFLALRPYLEHRAALRTPMKQAL